MIEENECEKSPAVLLKYNNDNWQAELDKYYRDHPNSYGQVFVVLLPSGGRFKPHSNIKPKNYK